MFAWRNRRKLSKGASSSSSDGPEKPASLKDTKAQQKRSAQPTAAATTTTAARDEPPSERPRRHSFQSRSRSVSSSSSTATTTTSVDVWGCDDADIGITSITVSRETGVLLYEISLRFPALGRLWIVHRSYAEFVALHAVVEGAFRAQLQARKIRLPRAARLSWESFRASLGVDDAAARKLLAKLNAYLHKLLEIEVVHMSDGFRAFLTPRKNTLDIECLGKLALPSTNTAMTRSQQLLPELLKRKMSVHSSSSSSLSPRASLSLRTVQSLCAQTIPFGSAISFAALGGLQVGLTRRSALSGSQKAVAVAAGVAGVALTGPLSAVFALGALGGGMGKYQMNKASYLSVSKPRAMTANAMSRLQAASSSDHSSTSTSTAAKESEDGTFLVENAEMFSGPRRAVKFGDLLHLYCKRVRKSVRIGQPPDSKRGHFMVTAAESDAATLRLVSPYGYSGNIVCGSQVYIQVVHGCWDGEFMGVHGEFLSSGTSPTVFQICSQGHACNASNGTSTAVKTIASPELQLDSDSASPSPIVNLRVAPAQPFKLRVMAYNVWLMPGILSSFNGKLSPFAPHRARAIPSCLSSLDVDVVVFCEAFCSSSREILVAGMKENGFLYETKVVGEGASMSSKKAIDGGCFAMSKYPINNFQEMTFSSVASGDDRMADKGVVYFQLRVCDTETVHVFGTHLQAWETPVAVATRRQQLKLLREFINSMKISSQDAVLIVGDLNVNKWAGDDGKEYAAMLETLSATEPELAPHSSAFSFDPLSNELAVDGPSSSGKTERLDYVLVVNKFRAPLVATSEVVQLKATSAWTVPQSGDGGDEDQEERLVDLSDHYPVVAELHF
ncbi:Phospholipase c [Globisporangium polare]